MENNWFGRVRTQLDLSTSEFNYRSPVVFCLVAQCRHCKRMIHDTYTEFKLHGSQNSYSAALLRLSPPRGYRHSCDYASTLCTSCNSNLQIYCRLRLCGHCHLLRRPKELKTFSGKDFQVHHYICAKCRKSLNAEKQCAICRRFSPTVDWRYVNDGVRGGNRLDYHLEYACLGCSNRIRPINKRIEDIIECRRLIGKLERSITYARKNQNHG